MSEVRVLTSCGADTRPGDSHSATRRARQDVDTPWSGERGQGTGEMKMGEQLHSTVVAREFLDLSTDGLSQQKLQKLVYFAHGAYMIDRYEDGLAQWSRRMRSANFSNIQIYTIR